MKTISRLLTINKNDLKYFTSAFVIVAIVFSSVVVASQAYAATAPVTLSVSVQTSLTFSVPDTGAAAFGNLVPGTPKYATSTLSVLTNDTLGYVVSLSGDNKSTGNNNLQLTGTPAVQIADQTEWVPGVATTSAGNAANIAGLASSGNVLAFRVMTASSTNGSVFYSTSWWGSADYNAGSSLYAGISSSTVQRTIGNAGAGSYSSSAHLNTVQYYLNVAATQQTGSYTAPLTYTAVGN